MKEESDGLYMKDPKAKTLDGFIEAINIFSKYTRKGLNQSYFFSAEHDVIYTVLSTEEITEDSEDGIKLIMLGWHCDSDGVWSYYT